MEKIESQKNLPELVYDAIVNAIVEGTLKPGHRVTQEGLAERLNVSRLPVGQALKRLQAEGFLTSAGRRGLMVSLLDERFVRGLYEFRSGIDQVSAGLAARHADPSARERGQRIITAGYAAGRANDLPALIEADMQFHQFIYELSDNPFVMSAMEAHWNHIRRIMRDILVVQNNQEQIWQEHAAVLEAVCSGDVATAESLARHHVENASDWLREALARTQAVSQTNKSNKATKA